MHGTRQQTPNLLPCHTKADRASANKCFYFKVDSHSNSFLVCERILVEYRPEHRIQSIRTSEGNSFADVRFGARTGNCQWTPPSPHDHRLRRTAFMSGSMSETIEGHMNQQFTPHLFTFTDAHSRQDIG
jgi:hypothetical protein